ncbi:hypothetical protein D3C80_1320760 [compost metagenome]
MQGIQHFECSSIVLAAAVHFGCGYIILGPVSRIFGREVAEYLCRLIIRLIKGQDIGIESLYPFIIRCQACSLSGIGQGWFQKIGPALQAGQVIVCSCIGTVQLIIIIQCYKGRIEFALNIITNGIKIHPIIVL